MARSTSTLRHSLTITTPLFENNGEGELLRDHVSNVGIAELTYPFLGWGTGFIDYDNDGWKDIFVANGHIFPQTAQHNWGTTYAERPLLFHNLDHGAKV